MATDVTHARASTDAMLAELAAGRWRPTAWWQMLLTATQRAGDAARARPRAAVQVAAFHLPLAMLARRARWPAASFVLAVTHLGLLGSRSTLGAANLISLTRANLPAVAPGRPRWLPALALATDLLDGPLARELHAETAFGAYADSLADAAFWTWYASGQGPTLRAAGIAAWALPVLTVTAVSMRGGQMIDTPRPRLLRPAAALQWALAVRALRA